MIQSSQPVWFLNPVWRVGSEGSRSEPERSEGERSEAKDRSPPSRFKMESHYPEKETSYHSERKLIEAVHQIEQL